MDLVQQIGRASRDGVGGKAIVVTNMPKKNSVLDEETRFYFSTTGCLRAQEYDGPKFEGDKNIYEERVCKTCYDFCKVWIQARFSYVSQARSKNLFFFKKKF